MSSPKSHADKTSAADKSIGFDYQYYYFLLKVLNLKVGQSVGLEVQDDVHTTLDQSKNILYQLKHTTKNGADGKPVALTRLDKDMWKTFYNWAMVISDEHCNRKDKISQLEFVKKSEFHLVANKSINSNNTVISAIENLQSYTINLSEVQAELDDCLQSTTDDEIKKYIQKLLNLDPSVLERLLLQTHFELELDDIKTEVRKAIREFHVDSNKVDTVFSAIDSTLRSQVFDTVKAGKPMVISFEDFHQKYRKYFQDARSTKLSLPTFTPSLPTDIFNQLFIKRLIEIDAIDSMDEEEAERLTLLKLQIASHLEHWEQQGEITTIDKTRLEDDVKQLWSSMFKLRYRHCPDEKIEETGRDILDNMLQKTFNLSEDVLSVSHSNGEVYHIADLGHIGWHKHWNTK